MTKRDIMVRPMRSKDEVPLIADMLGKSFPRGYETMWEQAHRAHATSPYFDPKYTRLAVLAGEIVGHVRIQPNVFKLGAARLRVGGIGDVTTHFRQRKKGIAAAAMIDAIDFMKEDGFDLSILFGIPNFYHRFGFAPVIPPAPTLTLDAPALDGLKQRHRCRAFRAADIPKLDAFKRRHDPLDTLSVCRTPAHWRYRLSRWAGSPLFYDKRGRLVAYMQVSAEQDQVRVHEVVAAPDEEVYASVVKELARRARRQVVRRIALQIPPDHPMAEYCIRFGCQYLMRYHKNADGLGRVINVGSFVRKMLPEWERLLSRSELAGKEGSLALSVDGRAMRLLSKKGRLALEETPRRVKGALRLTAQQFLQAAVGYAGLGAKLAELKGAGPRRMAEVLFPRRCPYLWRTDGF
ncbi:MAG: GNAT family N-acetyltransferase [Planctomycetes bacterium]|nr:GNAT family N-acetyltransferase [Planctomycetota bacterium]